MTRRFSALALAFALAAAGCRHNCGNACLTSNNRPDAPCHLTGSSRPVEGCFDAVTGQPVPCPPSAPVPGGAYPGIPSPAPGGRPDELPYPSPSGGDLIRPPGVPFAPPGIAPPTSDGYGTNVKGGPATKTGK